MKKILSYVLIIVAMATASTANAAEKYIIDTKNSHAFIQFRIQHLGYSWLYGRFNNFEGSFNIDRDNPENSNVEVTINTASVDTNHAERDKHLRSSDFLNVDKFPKATFKSMSLTLHDETSGVMKGNLTLNGVTKPIEIDVDLVGEGKDPWGGYRVGFEGNTTLPLKDFGITKDLGPASTDVEMMLSFEGVRQ